jgi:hypothetical protein
MSTPGAVAPHWYLNPDDPSTERYWNGGSWSPGARVAAVGTPRFPDSVAASSDPVTDPFQRRVLALLTEQGRHQERIANLLATMLALTVLAFVIGGIVALVGWPS